MKYLKRFWPLYLITAIIFIGISMIGDKAVTTMAEAMPLSREVVFVIDAGHGGEDGGAVSCTGVKESVINLQIALRLNDLLHLLGSETVMIRTDDVSIHTEGNTVGARKASDLRRRAQIVNETEHCVLVSIHQNIFTQAQYSGAQMFYNNMDGAMELAQKLQEEYQSLSSCELTAELLCSGGENPEDGTETEVITRENFSAYFEEKPEKILFNILANDNDGDGRRYCAELAPGISEGKTNVLFPVLELVTNEKDWYGWGQVRGGTNTYENAENIYDCFIVNHGDAEKKFTITSNISDDTYEVTVPAHSGVRKEFKNTFTEMGDYDISFTFTQGTAAL